MPLSMKITPARRHFKDLAGNVNHFLITILVGLDAVRQGKAELSPAFSTSWAPHNPARSADRSAEFAIKALLAWLTDALDAYTRVLNRKPFLIQDPEARQSLDAIGLRVGARVAWLADHTEARGSEAYALSVAGIVWRNRLVHTDADNEVPSPIEDLLKGSTASITSQYRGLDVNRMLEALVAGRSPRFKEATSLAKAAHDFVEQADRAVLKGIDLDIYFEEALGRYIAEDPATRVTNVWGKDPERRLKSIRQIAFQAGLTPEPGAPELADTVIEAAAKLSVAEARTRYAT
jgi:hypothetical protein